MKTKITIITMIAVMLSCMSANAQIAVNGIEVFSKLTKEQVIENFGKPDKYRYEDTGENGINEWYHYGENRLMCKDNYLLEVSISDNRFKVNLDGLENNIAIGDHISALEPLRVEEMTWFAKNWYTVVYAEYDEQVVFKIINDIITCICFSTTSTMTL